MVGVVFVRLRRILPVVLVVLVAASACSDDKKSEEIPPAAPQNKLAALKIGSVTVHSAGPDVHVPKDTQKRALRLAQTYVDTALIAPLESGRPGDQFPGLFDPGLRAVATGADRPALTDAGVGAIDHFQQSASPVRLSALADGAGSFLYLATNFSVKVRATSPDGVLTSTHDVELTFAPAGKSWRITAYRVKAVRRPPGGPTTTTAAAAGSTG
jgi:hypothetical protein